MDEQSWSTGFVKTMVRCFSSDDMLNLFPCRAKNKRKLDKRGICLYSFEIAIRASCDDVARVLALLLASTDDMLDMVVHGRVYGKKSLVPRPDQTRAILPVDTIMKSLDVILSAYLYTILQLLWPRRPELMFCVRLKYCMSRCLCFVGFYVKRCCVLRGVLGLLRCADVCRACDRCAMRVLCVCCVCYACAVRVLCVCCVCCACAVRVLCFCCVN